MRANIIFIILFSVSLTASDFINLPQGASEVNEHSQCSYLSNNCRQNVFIPTKQLAEFHSFIRNMPACISNLTITGMACLSGDKCPCNYVCDTRTDECKLPK